MRWLKRVAAGCGALLHRRRVNDELDEEIRGYLEAAIEAGERSGLTREAATRAARGRVGSLDAIREHTRDAGWEAGLEHVWRDVRYAGRALRKAPVFTVVAVLMLTLGIGANTAIFSAINAVVLRPIPVARPTELVSLATAFPDGVEPVFSYRAFRTIATEGAALVDAVAASTARREAITVDGPPEPVDLKWVSGNYFTTLGVPAASGRTFAASPAAPGAGETVAVISDKYWTRRFGRDQAVIGRSFRFRTSTFTIIGVARRGFSGESPGEAVDVWMPMEAQPGAPPSLWNGHSTTWLRILARRRPSVAFERTRAGLEPIYRQVRDEIAADTESPEYRASVLGSRLVVADASRGSSRVRDNFGTPLLILMGVVGLVLLVACANLANLMLARTAVRRREAALSLALGASRGRLVRQRLTEALLLALAGGAGGVLLATWAVSALAAALTEVLPVSLDLGPDVRVLGFALGASLLTALACGWLPARRAAGIDLLPALKASGQSGRDRRALGRSLVVVQIAVSMVLLVGAGLFVRSLIALERIDTGFDPARVLLLRVTPSADAAQLPLGHRRQLFHELLERAERVPGVSSTSASFSGVFSRGTWRNTISIDGVVQASGVTPRSYVNAITSRYFDVMRIAVIGGRGFTAADRDGTPRVAVVNETFVRSFFGTAAPLGRRVSLCTSDPCSALLPEQRIEIVGVVEDAKYVDRREEPRAMLYVPVDQVEQTLGEVQVRTDGDPAPISAALHRALAAGDRRLALVAMTEARTLVRTSIAAERLVAQLSTAFGALALVLAAVGLYGLVACITVQRTGEIGIRMALGASRRHVQGLVLRDTLMMLAIGTAIGLPAALALARLLAGQLYGVPPSDPAALAAASGILVAAALLAGYLPARRASHLDPVRALRAE